MKLKSNAFEDGGIIPVEYTCDGVNISPPLQWEDIPSETISLALICDDPDAPSKVWTHWLIFNLPGKLEGLNEGVETKENLEMGAMQGLNDSGRIGYSGPCPPGGVHRYFFKLYALNKKLELRNAVSKEYLLDTMEGHVLAYAELMGVYSR